MVNFSFATKIDIKLFKETYQYNLKNIEIDLKKDINFICDDLESCEKKSLPNNYQLKETDDQQVRQFIIALKTKRYKEAAELFNSTIKSGGKFKYNDNMLLPSIYPLNYARSYIGLTPFGNGLLGITSEGHVFNGKYLYITIKDNILYRVKMNGNFSVDGFTNGAVIIDDGINKFNLPIKGIEPNYTKDNRQELHQRLFNYIQGKEKSKQLDERTNAFKAKVKKLFR